MKLNAQQLAAIAAGATAEMVASLATVELEAPAKTAAELEAEVLAASEAEAAAKLAADEAATQLAADEAAAKALDVPNPLVAHLTAQLAVAHAAVTAAEVKAAGFQAAAEAQEGLLAIARESLSHKLVALGGSDASASTFTAQSIVAEHTRVSDLFKEKFKIGGVAKVAAPAPKAVAVDPVFAATLQHSIPQ